MTLNCVNSWTEHLIRICKPVYMKLCMEMSRLKFHRYLRIDVVFLVVILIPIYRNIEWMRQHESYISDQNKNKLKKKKPKFTFNVENVRINSIGWDQLIFFKFRSKHWNVKALKCPFLFIYIWFSQYLFEVLSLKCDLEFILTISIH